MDRLKISPRPYMNVRDFCITKAKNPKQTTHFPNAPRTGRYLPPNTFSNSNNLLAASPKVCTGVLGFSPNFSFHSRTSSDFNTFCSSLPSLGSLPSSSGTVLSASTAIWELYLFPPIMKRLLATAEVVRERICAVARSRTSIYLTISLISSMTLKR